MRHRPYLVFATSVVVAGGAVVYAHYSQVRDMQRMHEGVLRDKERLRQQELMQREGKR